MLSPSDDPQWYRDAVIYEVHVRAFADSNGDGIGDFPGLTSRLDYLQQLGVTALWLLPFYPSPLRDDGYDIADYGSIHPVYGSMRDFTTFLREAHERGLHVINELVLNHTSDQHPWFQRSRRAKPGSRWRDYYVWSDTPDRYPGVRVIFEDFETSNWTWDPVAGAYYWHRFFSHQPDLNYDNPEVRQTMLRAIDQWFELGVDGVRLDAVPYLFEREGTNCENLPETHAELRALRAHVDEHFPGRMLLAEANQWPEDAVAYFGDGDECHMAFHFPVMPRLFMGLRMEDRTPIIDILQQTPDIPEGCQWATFLRNHDELTLEMVTDEERDYMYRSYAADPQMRVNVGIRRRLAPLLGNDRRTIELMYALLFSLPGTPVMYYGDELGMGDNVYLGDRDSVRTPMQWSPDRNAGFSKANPQQLYLPAIIDPEYHYESLNVEAHSAQSASLLNWVRRAIAVRQRHPVFGRGGIDFLFPDNAKVFAFVRHDGDERMLVVANLSRHAQSVQLDLHDDRGAVPVELFGGTTFPQVGEGQYPLTLGPYGFYWFALDTHARDALADASGSLTLPTLRVADDWQSVFRTRTRGGHALERILPEYLARTRWYAGRTRNLRSCEVVEYVPLPGGRGEPAAFTTLIQVEYETGEPETYQLLLTTLEEGAEEFLADEPESALAWIDVRSTGRSLLLVDALALPSVAQRLLDVATKRRGVDGRHGKMQGSSTPALRKATPRDLPAMRLVGEQSNTSVTFGSAVIMKVFRRAQEGVNPDLELGRYLTDEARFEHTAPLLGAVEHQVGRGEPRTLAVVNAFVPNEGDAWRYTLDALGLFYDRALVELSDDMLVEPAWADLLRGAEAPPPGPMAEAIGPYLAAAEQLGVRTAELHAALAAGEGEVFEPEPYTTLSQRSLYQSVQSSVRPTMAALRRCADQLDDQARALAEHVAVHTDEITAAFHVLREHRIDTSRIRIHGDLHLGQVLHVGSDWYVIDFEGEPSRSPSERRIKRSALVDVAGMVRSFQYATAAALDVHVERAVVPAADRAALEARGRAWQLWVTARYLDAYLAASEGAPWVPADLDDVAALLRVHLLDKALYEVRYDLAHRPHWVGIPLRGLAQLLEAR